MAFNMTLNTNTKVRLKKQRVMSVTAATLNIIYKRIVVLYEKRSSRQLRNSQLRLPQSSPCIRGVSRCKAQKHEWLVAPYDNWAGILLFGNSKREKLHKHTSGFCNAYVASGSIAATRSCNPTFLWTEQWNKIVFYIFYIQQFWHFDVIVGWTSLRWNKIGQPGCRFAKVKI